MKNLEDTVWTMETDGNPFEEEDFENAFSEDEEESAKAVNTVAMKQPDTVQEPGDTEKQRRAAHETAEAQRKAEWEARIQAKKAAEQEQAARLMTMSHEELIAASTKRIGAETEKITRRNMKESVSEYIQALCFEEADFARCTMNPKKTMIHCFQYINRKAWDYVQDEIKASGQTPGRDMRCYASDIPDDLCYQWAEEYFRTENVKEDQEEEEKFVSKPYVGKATGKGKEKKTAQKTTATAKTTVPQTKMESKKEPVAAQMSFMEQLTLEGVPLSEAKAG